MKMHCINLDRFVPLLVKRWKRNPDYKASDLSELKSLTWYKDALTRPMREEVCQEIERLARQEVTP